MVCAVFRLVVAVAMLLSGDVELLSVAFDLLLTEALSDFWLPACAILSRRVVCHIMSITEDDARGTTSESIHPARASLTS